MHSVAAVGAVSHNYLLTEDILSMFGMGKFTSKWRPTNVSKNMALKFIIEICSYKALLLKTKKCVEKMYSIKNVHCKFNLTLVSTLI